MILLIFSTIDETQIGTNMPIAFTIKLLDEMANNDAGPIYSNSEACYEAQENTDHDYFAFYSK